MSTNTTGEETYGDRVQAWMKDATYPIGGQGLLGSWTSPPLPSKRFGQPAWVSFRMSYRPGDPMVERFNGWLVFADKNPRLLAYIDRAVAGDFGVVQPWSKSSCTLKEEACQTEMERLARNFFEGGHPTNEDRRWMLRALERVDRTYLQALEMAVPDFLDWVRG